MPALAPGPGAVPCALLLCIAVGIALGRWSASDIRGAGTGGSLSSCMENGIMFHGIRQDVPRGGPTGSCWCGDADGYCLCTPSLSVDIILFVPRPPRGGSPGVVLVRRRFPPLGLGIVGGFVDVGESVEDAAVRETKEETGEVQQRPFLPPPRPLCAPPSPPPPFYPCSAPISSRPSYCIVGFVLPTPERVCASSLILVVPQAKA